MFSKKLFYFTIVSCVLKEGSLRLHSKEVDELKILNNVLPIVRNSLSDCPMYYYKYGETGAVAPAAGAPAFLREFAHMAAIGWTQADGRIEWDCGGSLITEDIILTAAHCTSRENVKPDVARMGDLDLYSDKDDKYAQQIKIIEIIRHENYKFSSNYFDIAILRLEHPIEVHDTVCPACLWNDANVEFPRLEATGWGDTGFGEKKTPILLKVSLAPNKNEECNTYYEKTRKLENGIIDSQICAGDEKMDTCPGDSGGPLQIKLLGRSHLTPFIVGVTSFGPACGLSTPAVYTRVSSYIDWIEDKIKTTFNPIECTLRFVKFRDYEPDIIISKNENFEQLDLSRGHVQTSSRFNNKASLGYRNTKKEFTELSSGVLIADNYVLTTASGINSNKISPGLVGLGSGDIIEIDKIIMHPQFDPSTNGNDIALIRLKKDIEINMDTQLPSCLWSYSKIPAIGQYDGIGTGPRNINRDGYFDEESLRDYSITQLTLKFDIIESAECTKAYYSNRRSVTFRNQSIVSPNGISNSQFCAGYTRFFIVPGMCELDYGNTLQHKLTFNTKYFVYDFGLNSFGHQCGFGVPAVFTRVSSYLHWIDSIVFGNAETSLPTGGGNASDIHFSDDDYKLGDKCMISKKDDGECVSTESCPQSVKAFREKKSKLQFCSLHPTISICCPQHLIQKQISLLNRNSNPNICTTSYIKEKKKYKSADFTYPGKYSQFYKFFFGNIRPLVFEEYPHTALITWNAAGADKPCIGALISLNFVITTASCVSSKNERPEFVRLGVNSTEEGSAFEQKFKIADIIFHPEFLAQNVIDLALIKLDGSVKVTSFVMPACLWANTTHTPFDLISTGVSPTNAEILGQSRNAKYNADCKRKYYSNLKDDELCADPFSTDSNTCEEKTGDILQAIWFENDVVHHYIVGFFARVDECKTYPSVYKRITPYIDWIKLIIT